jgi:nucleoid-associated protein YgaU
MGRTTSPHDVAPGSAGSGNVAPAPLPGIGRPGHTSVDAPAIADDAEETPEGPAAGAGAPDTAPTAGQRTEGDVVVAPGDCLWDIAARMLGSGASNADIAVEWPRWYAANREVVGGDPDLLMPGMVLRPPAGH